VYLCEDIHGAGNRFHAYLAGVAQHLHVDNSTLDFANPERRVVVATTPFQAAVASIHFYPYVAVIELNAMPVAELVAPKRGTRWEPFGDAWDAPYRPD